jgi:ATP-dependent protease ClpP protease subunit
MLYFKRHWRGELSLAVSFWVNFVLVTIIRFLLESWLAESSAMNNPMVGAQIASAYIFVTLALIYPWQLVGLWRSAVNHAERSERALWSSLAKIVVGVSLIQTVVSLNALWPTYRYLYQTGFRPDKLGDYQVELADNRQLIHLEGGFGLGIAREVEQLIAENPSVNGIILDSVGGRVSEGRELSKIILSNGLDTYTLTGCHSACGIAFISGKKRYMAKGANLAFHQYRAGLKSVESTTDLTAEQTRDLAIFRKQGISQKFMDRLYSAKSDDFWYPTIYDMLTSGVIHEIVDPTTLISLNYNWFNASELDNSLKGTPGFSAIKEHDPEIYQQIITVLGAQLENGASLIEIQGALENYIGILARKSFSKTSDRALIMYANASVIRKKKLERTDPILCMKSLFPQQYGALDPVKYYSDEEIMPMMDALGLIVADSYIFTNPAVNADAAVEVLTQIKAQLGEDSRYLEPSQLRNKAEYSKACKTFIRINEAVLSNPSEVAGNVFRYMYSQ